MAAAVMEDLEAGTLDWVVVHTEASVAVVMVDY